MGQSSMGAEVESYRGPRCRLGLKYYSGPVLPSLLLKGHHSYPLTLAGSLYIPAHIPPLALPYQGGGLSGQGDGWVVPRVSKFNTGPQAAVSQHIIQNSFSVAPGWRQGI